MSKTYPFVLPNLPYSYDELSPVLGSDTLHFHHDKHMNTYVDNLNKALENCSEFHNLSLDNILTKLNELPESIQTAVKNNGGGVYNHQLYFSTLVSPESKTKPSEELQSAIIRDFGSFDNMISLLKQSAVGRFGSGWAYLITNPEGILSICSTPNQDVPDLSKFIPLMTVDVWEHAYYLDYQNRRPDYFDALISLIDWNIVSERYKSKKFEF